MDQEIEPKKKKAGRPKGSKNKVSACIQEMAEPYGKRAVATLRRLMDKSDNEAIRLQAAKELLDRGYGKPTQVQEKKIEKTVRREYSDTELARRVAFMLEKAREARQKDSTEQVLIEVLPKSPDTDQIH